MSSPYINTKLYSVVSLAPNQMNNDLYSHLKNNLIKRYEGKCFRHYGFISKIYEIQDKKGGMLDPENPMAAAMFECKFSCRLCIPLKMKYIICKITQTTQAVTAASNGPIKVILTNDRINPDKFIVGRTGILVKAQGSVNIRQLMTGDHVKIKIDSRKFNNGDTIIMCMGVLDSMAKENEIAEFEADEYNTDSKFIDYDKYIQIEEKKNDIELIAENLESESETETETEIKTDIK